MDTNVLLDVLGADSTFGPRSRIALDRCLAQGSLIVCDVVWAETAAAFPRCCDRRVGIHDAGSGLQRDQSRGSPSGGNDFLVGAHALTQADRLLTRDRGFRRGYFDGLTILDPTH